MQTLTDFFHRLSDLPTLVQWAGLFGIAAIIFSETGLLVGVFLPGDSLLVTAALFAAKGYLNVYLLAFPERRPRFRPVGRAERTFTAIAVAICGNSLGYFIGRTSGPRIFSRENSLFFNKKHAMRAHDFYEKHGKKTIVLAQFMPVIRTFAPVIAGVAGMRFHTFIAYNVFGALFWIWSMLGIGYFLGNYIPGIDQHIEIVVVVVVFISILPGIISAIRARRAKRYGAEPAVGG
jgi:membrane-associated protein